jgi:hypothetical protein
MMTIQDAIEQYSKGCITAIGLVNFYFQIELKHGWKKRYNPKDIYTTLGISKATFYRAIAKLQVEGYISFEVHGEITVTNTCLRNEIKVSDLRQQSQVQDDSLKFKTTVSDLRQQSQVCDNKTPEPLSGKDSSNAPDLYIYSSQISYREGEEDARENFSNFHPPTPSNKGNRLREESTANTRQNYPDGENNFLFAPYVDNKHHNEGNHPAPLANPENLTDIQQWANEEIGRAVKLYRKSGIILTGGCDINGDFAVFVGRRNSKPGHQDLAGLGFNVILKCEKDPQRWQQLVVWAHDWSNGGNVAAAAANHQQQQEIKEIDPETAKQLKELGIEI